MKPSFELVRTGDTTSVKVKTYTRGSLNVPLHYHPEHEIVLVLSGRGKVIVSDVAASFVAGDLLLIGGNVPHLYVDDAIDAGMKNKIKVVVIQFKEKLFDSLLHIPEFYRTGQFLAQMRQGVKVSRLNGLDKHLTSLVHKRGVDKFNTLVYILDSIVRKGRYEVIAQAPDCSGDRGSQLYSQRLREVYAIVQKNYTRDISVNEVAALVHLSKTSFCRFLKKEVGKTFTEILNEERIKYACALLRETTYTVTQVSYQAGFNNPSHFFRQFRKLRRVSPNIYKQKFRPARRLVKARVQE